MSTNCLVKKLKGSVDNDKLIKFNTLYMFADNEEGSDEAHTRLIFNAVAGEKIIIKTPTQYPIISVDSHGVKIDSNTAEFVGTGDGAANYLVVVLSPGTYPFTVFNKNELLSINTNGLSSKGRFYIDTEKSGLLQKITSLYISLNESHSITTHYLSTYVPNITDINFTRIEDANGFNGSVVELGKLISLNNIILIANNSAINVTGNVEEMIALMAEKRKSGTLNTSFRSALVRFNGKAYGAGSQSNNTTITFNFSDNEVIAMGNRPNAEAVQIAVYDITNGTWTYTEE